jgi:hypothetical protein
MHATRLSTHVFAQTNTPAPLQVLSGPPAVPAVPPQSAHACSPVLMPLLLSGVGWGTRLYILAVVVHSCALLRRASVRAARGMGRQVYGSTLSRVRQAVSALSVDRNRCNWSIQTKQHEITNRAFLDLLAARDLPEVANNEQVSLELNWFRTKERRIQPWSRSCKRKTCMSLRACWSCFISSSRWLTCHCSPCCQAHTDDRKYSTEPNGCTQSNLLIEASRYCA